jgi:hypothetical protein
LFTGLPFLPPASRGVSVHISFTFSKTMLQCRSKALTLAKSFRLLRQDIRTWVCDRTAVCKIERGPEVNSCSSRSETSYSLQTCQNNRRCKLRKRRKGDESKRIAFDETYVSSARDFVRRSLARRQLQLYLDVR